MKIKSHIVAVMISLCLGGCYLPISGRVVDAETNAPIEGAVVLVEWTKTHGIGDHWTESYKVAETVSDKDGKFDLPGCYSPFVNRPDLTIYKKGYVAWNNKIVFPEYEKRKDFRWGDDEIRLEKFKKGYSYEKHVSFIRTSIHSIADDNKIMIKAAFDWEIDMKLKERER